MFRRIIHEHWHDLVPVIAFILTFAVFVVAFVRALLAPKKTVARMAALPLDLGVEPREPAGKSSEGCSDACSRCASCRRQSPDPAHDSHPHPHHPDHQHLH